MKTNYLSLAVHGIAALTTCFALSLQLTKVGSPVFELPLSLLVASIFGIHLCAIITKRKMLAFQSKSGCGGSKQNSIFSSQISKLKQVKLGLKITNVLVSDICCAMIVVSLNVIATFGDFAALISFEYGTIIVLGLVNLMFVIADNQDRTLERRAKLESVPSTDNLLLNAYLVHHKKAA